MCVYGGETPYCDCKYRPEDPKYMSSEVSGCPEVQAAITILSRLTDAQFNELANSHTS